uniref:Uncharacterized protein n=1 Tax=Arundo donax TaxID=35708 RepID=A0A0A9AHD2_ARUDO
MVKSYLTGGKTYAEANWWPAGKSAKVRFVNKQKQAVF